MKETGSKLGKLGGPLLGGAGKIVDRVLDRPSQAAADTARDMGERAQGRAAHRASRTGNIVMQMLGGRKLPTRRAEAQMIQRGNEWSRSQNELAAGTVRSRHDTAYLQGGVASGKAALVEAAGAGSRRDSIRRASEQAVIQLINTNSWIEIQNSLIPSGRNGGKRITKTRVWQDTLSRPDNSQLWAEVARRRPDLTPDIIQSAQNAAGYEYDQVPGTQPALLDALDRLCIAEAISRFDATTLPNLHEGIFNEIARLNDPVLSQHLYNSLSTIAHAPGDIGPNALGALAGPRAVAIDTALAPIGQNYATI